MSYELNRDDIFNFAATVSADTYVKGDELFFKHCPYCNGGSHNDTDTFSINLNNGAFCCLRASCGEKGHFVELCRDFNFSLEFEKPNIYKELKQPKKAIVSKPEAIKYLESRGISEEVCRAYEITTRNDNPSVLVFPFYDEGGKLQMVKYRNCNHKKGDRTPKEWCEKDTMPILFGMKQVPSNEKTLIITEGQCFSGDAEVFTQNGWIRFDEYRGEDVMQVDTGMVGRFVAPNAIIRKAYKGDMVETAIGGNYYSFTTPDHNIVYQDQKGRVIKREAGNHVSSGYSIPTTVKHSDSRLGWSNDLIALYLAVSADGTIYARKTDRAKSKYYARFGLLKRRKVDRLIGVLQRLNIEYKKSLYISNDKEYCSISFSAPKEICSKELPWEFVTHTTVEQKMFILRELLHWDGCRTPNRNQGEYYTNNRHNADVVQAIAHTCGVMASVYRKVFGSNFANPKMGYRVNILFAKNHISTQQRDKNTRFIPYKGTVYCVSVPSGMLLVRQDGKVSVSGNCDQLSLATVGFRNAVSVPTGATGFTWLIPCKAFLERFETIIVFGDWERGKMSLIDTIKARVTTAVVKAVRQADYLGEKDANDILRKYGADALRKAVANAEIPRLENVKDLASVESVDVNELPKIKTGIESIDRVIGGICLGQVMLLTGRRGAGKSTLLSQIVANALEQDIAVFAYSGELADFHFKRWLDYQLAGNENITERRNEYGDPIYSVNENAVEKISRWYKCRAFVYDNEYLPENEDEFESLTETIERVIIQYGVTLICIDNLMTAMDVVSDRDNLYLAQSNFVGKLKKIALRYKVGIILVAHPRKAFGALTNDDVSGSSDITNKVDTVLTFDRMDEDNQGHTVVVQVLKNRLFGKLRVDKSAIPLYYSPKSRRIFDSREYDGHTTHYGWERMSDNKKLDESATETPDILNEDVPDSGFEEVDILGYDLPF